MKGIATKLPDAVRIGVCAVFALACASCSPANETDVSAVATQSHPDALYRVETNHSIVIRGESVDYKAIAGETLLYDMAGAPVASIFSFSYIRTNPADAERPVLFIFNGGPGAASLWLHMGAVGPRRLVLDSEVNPSNVPPFGVADNPYSVLDVADLVFIDPVGTGFSKVVGAGNTSDFWGVDEDANAVAQFIELWLDEYGRWNAPKFLMGESYGSIRAAVLPRALMGGPFYTGVMRGVTLNGIILLGTMLEARTETGAPVIDAALGNALALPSIAATAWSHGKGGKQDLEFDELYAAAHAFATGTYLEALHAEAADGLSDRERESVKQQLADYSGLATEDLGETLVITPRDFAKQLLQQDGLEVGIYDSRYTMPLANSGGDPVADDPVADDPAMGRYVPGFVAAFHQMLRDDLKVGLKRPYGAIVWKDLLNAWNWERGGVADGQSYAVDLAWAMRRNPDLRLLVAGGYFDLATPPSMALHAIEEAGLPADRVEIKNYASGHMLYLGGTSEAFADDVRSLILASGGEANGQDASP